MMNYRKLVHINKLETQNLNGENKMTRTTESRSRLARAWMKPATSAMLMWLAMFVAPMKAAADGGMWYQLTETGTSESASQPVLEQAQQAMLYFDAENGTESLILQAETVDLSGGFAWIIPLPYIPAEASQNATVFETPTTVSEVDLFALIAEITRPRVSIKHHYYTVEHTLTPWGCACALNAGQSLLDRTDEADDLGLNVDVWSSGTTDNLAYNQISCGWNPDGSPDLADMYLWLHANGYGNFPPGSYWVFESYSQRNYSFLVVTGREQAAASSHSRLSITFPTDRIVYPMLISTLGFGEQMDLSIAVFSEIPLSPTSAVVSDFLLALLYNENYWSGLSRSDPAADSESIHASRDPEPWSLMSPYTDLAEIKKDILNMVAEHRQTGQFWQDAAFVIDSGSNPQLTTALTDTLPPGTDVPETMWLTAFSTRYTNTGDMVDIVFEETLQTPFRAQVHVHVDLKENSDVAARASVDWSPVFPLLFLVWTRVKKRLASHSRQA